jgi:hypothetical protein
MRNSRKMWTMLARAYYCTGSTKNPPHVVVSLPPAYWDALKSNVVLVRRGERLTMPAHGLGFTENSNREEVHHSLQ